MRVNWASLLLSGSSSKYNHYMNTLRLEELPRYNNILSQNFFAPYLYVSNLLQAYNP